MIYVEFKDAEVMRLLTKIQSKTKDITPFFRRLGEVLIANYKRNMASGKDPNGKNLDKIDGWTRFAGIGRGRKLNRSKFVPLRNTGKMMASLARLRLSKKRVTIGFHGKQRAKAVRMMNGASGEMTLRKKGIKGEYSGIRKAKKDGHEYARIKTRFGWRTKQVTSGTVEVNPRPREFFFLGGPQEKIIVDQANIYLRKLARGAA